MRGIDGATLLACLTAIFYGWGTTYEVGFGSIFHLNASVMENSFHQVIYQGAILTMAPVALTLMILVIFLFLYSDLLLPVVLATMESSFRLKRKYLKVLKWFNGKRKPSLREVRAKSVSLKAFSAAAAVILYIVSLSYILALGAEDARARLDKFSNEEERENLIIKVNIEDEIKNLGFISCGARNCAGMDIDSKRIFYFPVDTGYSFKLVVDED